MSDYLGLIMWTVVIAAGFGFAWKQGLLTRLSVYVGETREELSKCTWPTVEELKGSTIVVVVSIALLGAFTLAVDAVIGQLLKWIMI